MKKLGIVCMVLLLLGGGIYLFLGEKQEQAVKQEIWTCSMHPQIQMPEPGQCPICGMDLILQSQEEANGTMGAISLSKRARTLAEVQTTPVVRKKVAVDLALYGELAFDETKIGHITARTPGRIEKLYLDFTGEEVEKGEAMAEFYSPELVTAQQELIEASLAIKNIDPGVSGFLKESLQENLDSARKKLLLWGFTQEQVKDFESLEDPREVVTLFAPMSGVVIEKEVTEGTYVKEGTKIYTIANLEELWVILEAYQSDLVWLTPGQYLSFKSEAYPGEVFTGRIEFIDPYINEKTRTVQVRANVKNSGNLLKPGAFVKGVIEHEVASLQAVGAKEQKEEWTCPMHPTVTEDQAGSCPICKMDLEPVEEEQMWTCPMHPTVAKDQAGSCPICKMDLEPMKGSTSSSHLPLAIPKTAVLITGKRAIVYVENPEKKGEYFLQEVVLGPRVKDEYIILKGLREGQRVVTHGNFKIDSAAQILGMPSMMNPEGKKKQMNEHSHH